MYGFDLFESANDFSGYVWVLTLMGYGTVSDRVSSNQVNVVEV